jgi:hypothetical protein
MIKWRNHLLFFPQQQHTTTTITMGSVDEEEGHEYSSLESTQAPDSDEEGAVLDFQTRNILAASQVRLEITILSITLPNISSSRITTFC